MSTESNVAIAPDNATAGAHNIRTVTVYPNAPATVSQGEKQQVVSLAGSDGTLIEAANGTLPVSSIELAILLRAIIVRLDILNALVDPRGYKPPDNLSSF